MLPEVEPEGDDDEPLVEPDVPLAVPDVDVSVLLVPVAPLEVEDGLVVGDVAVEPDDGVVVVVVEDGVVAVVEAPVPVEVLLAGRSQPVANAAARARAAVSEISFMSAPWFGGGKPLCTGEPEDAMEESAQRVPTPAPLRGRARRRRRR